MNQPAHHTTASTSGSTAQSPETHPALESSRDRPLDLLIVGAGLSGVDLAEHVHHAFPHWRWAAVDSGSELGGTWATFRYPGIRSDSDMATFSLPFSRWPHPGTLGSGAHIREYLHAAAERNGLSQHLQLSTWAEHAHFHTSTGLWEVTTRRTPPGTANPEGTGASQHPSHTHTVWTRRLHFASGYYRHSAGYTAPLPGLEDYAGTLIHPQHWPENLDVAGKHITIIGSGATAVTLLPALHNQGAHVTMLQRTPTYIAPLPPRDTISALVRGVGLNMEPGRAGARLARGLHIARDMAQYHLCQRLPALARGAFWAMNRAYLPAREVRANFRPPYDPWDQRVCKSPGGDFFHALRGGARVVTGKIRQVEAAGVRLEDGSLLASDILVTATGLQLLAFGGARFSVDGVDVPASHLVAYRAMMAHALPNFSYTIGYLNQSWTLRADMVSRYLVGLWREMEARGEWLAAPVLPAGLTADRPLLDMSSGYIRRSLGSLPRQGSADPWRMVHDYIRERATYRRGTHRIDMSFDDAALTAARRLAASSGEAGAPGEVGDRATRAGL